MIFLSAGHHFAPSKPDPGAVGNGFHENELTKELRDLTRAAIYNLGGSVIMDNDRETLGQYLARIKPGTGSVLCEYHFNASSNSKASGTECIYKAGADSLNVKLSGRIAGACSVIMGIANRGAKDETQSHRGRLAVLHTAAGLSCLPEIAFISNADDMRKYQESKHAIAREVARILVEFDNLRV